MSIIANLAEIGLQGFIDVYRQVLEEHPDQSEPFKVAELRRIMWARMLANESGMEKKSFKIPCENLKKTKLQFPYLPDDIRYTGCCAIKKNGDLYTPCCGKTKDSAYCQSCTQDKEGNAKELPYGSVEEREENIAAGKFTPVTYGSWLKKAKKTITQVYEALSECGISLVIPPEELETRDVPKNRKGRPAKSDDSTGTKGSKKSKKSKEPEEEDGYSSATSSVSSKSSQASKSSQGSKKAKAPEPEPEPEPEDEDAEPEPVKPVKKSKAKEPEPEPESDEEVKPKKAKKPKAEKAEKAEKPKEKAEKAEKAEKPEKKPKAEKAEKPEKKAKAEKAEKPEKKPKAEKAEKPKAEKPKAEKPEKPKAEKAKPKPVVEDSDDESIVAMSQELDAEEPEQEQETRVINGKRYINSNGRIYAKDGTYVGSVNEDGDWVDEDGDVMEADEGAMSDDE